MKCLVASIDLANTPMEQLVVAAIHAKCMPSSGKAEVQSLVIVEVPSSGQVEVPSSEKEKVQSSGKDKVQSSGKDAVRREVVSLGEVMQTGSEAESSVMAVTRSQNRLSPIFEEAAGPWGKAKRLIGLSKIRFGLKLLIGSNRNSPRTPRRVFLLWHSRRRIDSTTGFW